MSVAVDEAWHGSSAFEVDPGSVVAGESHNLALVTNGEEASILDGNSRHFGPLAVECRDPAVEQDEIGSAAFMV
jgi:hypothetical protein